MDNSFFNNIKSRENAFLKAYNVYNGSTRCDDYEPLQTFRGNTRMSIPIKLVKLHSGIFYFDIKQDSLVDSVNSGDECPVLNGVLNPHAKVVDDIEYRHYRLAIDYEKGSNFIRARYSTDDKSQVVFCDFNVISNSAQNDFFKFQITLTRAYNAGTAGIGTFYRMFSFFLKSGNDTKENYNYPYNALLIAEDLCSHFVEYNPMRNDTFPKDERKTHIFHFTDSGIFCKGETLFNKNDLQYSSMSEEDIKNISKKYFGFDCNTIIIDFAALIEKIMLQVDKKESIDLAKCIYTSRK
jgi:hypothetical protein